MNLEGPLSTIITLAICSGLLALLFNSEKLFKNTKTKTAHAETAAESNAEIAAAIGAVKAHTNSK
jgi:hypothetical protein